MNSLEFITDMMGHYSGTDRSTKQKYKKDLMLFVGKCVEDKLMDIYEYALTLRYKNIDMLFSFASENHCLKGQGAKVISWTCDHGGVGDPALVHGFQCRLCGDRYQESKGDN